MREIRTPIAFLLRRGTKRCHPFMFSEDLHCVENFRVTTVYYSTTLLPPRVDQTQGLTAPSMSVAPTARFGATVRVSRDTRMNVPFRVVVTNLLWDSVKRI